MHALQLPNGARAPHNSRAELYRGGLWLPVYPEAPPEKRPGAPQTLAFPSHEIVRVTRGLGPCFVRVL